ncbi:hypothetical protein BBW65_07320 [Helicobacter enhydrae]|uniref:DUF5666 domain-containing protein n=1 Tax=Helicobacter enhydrae TaxID=222136 RepID=A0A1B1U740_9HELI|nr:DUF5666 domain-containing protein [Helicobacter enhydrae]ANV98617.1 hypothetical protein BBW65_07320 [Helicobacter enhydrae]
MANHLINIRAAHPLGFESLEDSPLHDNPSPMPKFCPPSPLDNHRLFSLHKLIGGTMPHIAKITLFALVFSQTLHASDIKGLIQSINDSDKTISVNHTIIKVIPYTEIERESCRGDWDMPQQFKDIKIGDYVKIDIFYNENQIVAKEIEIKCLD